MKVIAIEENKDIFLPSKPILHASFVSDLQNGDRNT